MKKYVKTVFTFLLLFLLPILLLEGSCAAEGVRQGLTLAYRAVLPALFPAMMVCGIIGELSEYIPLPTAWTVWLTSHLCGFPLGIRTLTRTYQRGLLSRRQTIRLSACCANASPAFLVVYVGGKILESERAGVFLLIGQLLISLIIGLSNGAFKRTPPPQPEDKSIISVIVDGFSNAAHGGLILTGYITFFSMIAALLQDIPSFRYIYGFLELTGGIRGGLLTAAAMVGFSGCSAILQNAAFLADAKLPIAPMIIGKCIYGLSIPVICVILTEFADFL